MAFNDGSLISTTTIGTGSDSNAVVYSTTGRSNVPFRLIGRIQITQTTAGTWATSPSEVSVPPFYIPPIVAQYTSNAAQGIGDSSATIVDYEDRVRDDYNCVTTGASWKFTAPKTAYYLISGVMIGAAETGWELGEYVYLQAFVSNAAGRQLGWYEYTTGDTSASANAFPSIFCAAVVYLTAGQYLDTRLYHTNDGVVNLDTSVAIEISEIR
jgi:hypothetical protein